MAAVSLNNKTLTRSALAGNPGYLTGYEWISSVTVGSLGASSVSFTEIPQGYRHLQVRAIYRVNGGGAQTDTCRIRLNSSDTGYSGHSLYGNGTSASSLNATSQTYGWASRTTIPAAGSTASVFGAMVLDVLDYSSTVKNKTLRTLEGVDTNSTNGAVALTSSLWANTAAVTSMTFTDENAYSFVQFSTFSLYGIR